MSMGAAFVAAIDACYRVHGEPATYAPRDAVSISVTVIHDLEPSPSGGLESGALQTDVVLTVRVSEVADPKRGDKVTLEDGSCHEVRDREPVNRLEWRLFVR